MTKRIGSFILGFPIFFAVLIGVEVSFVTVSRENSKMVYEGIKAANIRFISALPETWLVYLLQLAEDDPEMCLVEVAKEEEAIGIAAGAYFAGTPNALLMQNHGFLGSINGIVSLALLYRVPLLMLIAQMYVKSAYNRWSRVPYWSWTRSACCRRSTERATSPSSAAAWSRTAARTCSSRRRWASR